MGTTETDSNGRYELALGTVVSPGGYKAVARKTEIGHGGDVHKCKKGTSKVIQVK